MDLTVRLNAWFNRKRWHVSAFIVLLSVVIRIFYFWDISSSPLIFQHRWEDSDMNFFFHWASEISKGDLLQDKSLHPLHEYHKYLASEYFTRNPLEYKKLSDEAKLLGVSPEYQLWSHWTGGKNFFQEPLYAYLVGTFFYFFGPHVEFVFLFQLAAGVLTNLLVYWATRDIFNDLTGVIAGVVSVLYAPFLFFEMILLRDSLITCFAIAIIYCISKSLEKNRARWFGFTGIVIGIGTMLKTIFFPFMALLAIYQIKQICNRNLNALAGLLVFFLCAVTVLSPVLYRNIMVGVSPFQFTSSAPFMFIISNGEDLRPREGNRSYSFKHVAEIMGETNGEMIPTVIKTIKTHNEIGIFFSNLTKKFFDIWHWYEIPDNVNFYYYRLYSKVLDILPISFLFIAPLGILGIVIGYKNWRKTWPLLALITINVGILVVFGHSSRYRLPITLALIPFSSYFLVCLLEWLSKKHFARLLLATTCLFTLTIFISRPNAEGTRLIRYSDYTVVYLTYFVPEAKIMADKKNWQEAANLISNSLSRLPPEIANLSAANLAKDVYVADLARFYSNIFKLYAHILENLENKTEALKQKSIADQLILSASSAAINEGGQIVLP